MGWRNISVLWIQFLKTYIEGSDIGHFIEDDVWYSEKLLNYPELHNNLSFLPERMKLEKIEKLVASVHDKEEYVKHIRNSKQQ